MNTDSETNASPYLSYYGMVREPFGQTIEDDLFYAEPSRKQKLDILLHLTQYGNELLVVTGPTGSGKTTLLQQYQRKSQDTWRVARIEAKGGIDERKLVQQLYHQLDMEYRGASHSDLLENLEHHLAMLQRSGHQAIMLIDDAEHLPVTALKQVLQMAELCDADNKPLVRIILFGTDKLTEHFADPLLGHHANIVRRSLELAPFDREQTAHYILHRLSAAQFAANEPFTDAALHKLHRQSAGWPGRINNLAHKLLLDTLPTTAPTSSAEHKGLVKPLRIFAAIVLSIIIGALLIFQDEVNQLINPKPGTSHDNNLPEKVVPARTVTEVTAPTEQAPLETPKQEEPTEPTTPAAPLASMPDVSLPATTPIAAGNAVKEETAMAPEEAKPSEPTVEETSESQQEVETSIAKTEQAEPTPLAVTAKSEITAEPKASSTAKPEPSPRPATDKGLPTRDNQWLLTQDDKHYTLQLVAGQKLATIQQYLTETLGDDPALQQELALYRSQRKGKPWYGLVLGTYPDKQAAIDARSHLPQRLLRTTPWVRTIGSIQRDLHTP